MWKASFRKGWTHLWYWKTRIRMWLRFWCEEPRRTRVFRAWLRTVQSRLKDADGNWLSEEEAAAKYSSDVLPLVNGGVAGDILNTVMQLIRWAGQDIEKNGTPPHRAVTNTVRMYAISMGDYTAGEDPVQVESRRVSRKCIVAVVDIPKGVRITGEMITTRRPWTHDICASRWDAVIGRRARRDIKANTFLRKKDIWFRTWGR